MELMTPPFPHAGEWAALSVSFFWTITVLSFESAGKRVGSMNVNLFRLVLGSAYLVLFGLAFNGEAFPLDATAHQWGWLGLSGLVGVVLGDLCLFHAFVVIGGRLSMAFYTSVPLFTALFDWLFLGHTLGLFHFLGMGTTCLGLLVVNLDKKDAAEPRAWHEKRRRGYALALMGSIAQAAGLILSKIGMEGMNPFAATQIRLLAGILGFGLLFTAIGHWGQARQALRDAPALRRIALGAVFGPFLGISLSLLALQYAKAGLVATLTSLTPILIIGPAVWLFHERVGRAAIVGAVLAVVGTAVMFL